MGVLPGFFDLMQVTLIDVTAIVMVSIVTPLLGNLILASFVNKARAFLQSSARCAIDQPDFWWVADCDGSGDSICLKTGYLHLNREF